MQDKLHFYTRYVEIKINSISTKFSDDQVKICKCINLRVLIIHTRLFYIKPLTTNIFLSFFNQTILTKIKNMFTFIT